MSETYSKKQVIMMIEALIPDNVEVTMFYESYDFVDELGQKHFLPSAMGYDGEGNPTLLGAAGRQSLMGLAWEKSEET